MGATASLDYHDGLREGRRKGQREMKRRAENVCRDYFRRHPVAGSMEGAAWMSAVREILEAIKALVVA